MILLFALAGLFALVDWIAVAKGRRWLEYVCKPAVIVALIAVALALETDSDVRRALFIAALVMSLTGDVLLMVPRGFFVPALAAFLAAHLTYAIGFIDEGVSASGAAVSVVAILVPTMVLGARIMSSVRAGASRLTRPVAAYMLVINVMVVTALATGNVLAGTGALLFYASDALLAYDRFVTPVVWSRPTVMVTYHLAQGALVASLAAW